MSIQFEYFYGNEAEQFTFYRIPKILVTSPTFKRVSDSAKLLYGLMLDRMGLSIRNGWVDDENRAYIFFTTNDVMEQMCCGTEKATKLLAELDSEKGIGLIERKKQGQGKPAIVYLKKFYVDEDTDRKPRLSETETPDFRKSKVQTFENRNQIIINIIILILMILKIIILNRAILKSYPILSIEETVIYLLPCLHQKALIRYDG
jgi:hypothetical protein